MLTTSLQVLGPTLAVIVGTDARIALPEPASDWRQVLQAQEYWRLKGLRADVVIVQRRLLSADQVAQALADHTQLSPREIAEER